MTDRLNYSRRPSSLVTVGQTPMGENNPIRVQSMATVSTLDTDAAVAQSITLIQAGAEYVRFTTQGEAEARNLGVIRTKLRELGYTTPLVADIHFNPKVAEIAAELVEKVRINPGNFVDPAKRFQMKEYDDLSYQEELKRIKDRFLPLLDICKKHGTALRIGVNHGSLSDRIMSRYGDTPQGMVESCMEFLRLCKQNDFNDVVISIKASNTVVMVQTVRLLVDTMDRESMNYPLHLGVTEAGEGEDGRVKSAVGIGTLLSEGIGDTIRVSLSEPPENEIPVARLLIDYISKRKGHALIQGTLPKTYPQTETGRLKTDEVLGKIGENHPPVVFSCSTTDKWNLVPDYVVEKDQNGAIQIIDQKTKTILPFYNNLSLLSKPEEKEKPSFIALEAEELTEQTIAQLKQLSNSVLILHSDHQNPVGAIRSAIYRMIAMECNRPIILHFRYSENALESLQIKAAADFGAILLDGFGQGIWIENNGSITKPSLVDCAFSILQGTRLRITKTEYISCPGCGRTLFDLQSTIAQVKAATSDLVGLKIAIMGCIVNGPGEMADADYGYVGAGRGKISLYKGKECVARNIEQKLAVNRLLELIRQENR